MAKRMNGAFLHKRGTFWVYPVISRQVLVQLASNTKLGGLQEYQKPLKAYFQTLAHLITQI